MPASRKIVLASKSPRRAQLLTMAGIDFTVRASDAEEIPEPGEAAIDYVRRLARAKASAVEMKSGEMILGADTVVVLSDSSARDILEKPTDAAEAQSMLRKLSGRTHEVITGVCLRSEASITVGAETTRVRFVTMTDEEIAEYANSGEPMDKAGAYAIQGLASKFIDRIEGCYFNVVGLPISLVYRMLAERS